ncbi:MAG TPA: hypothetical protein VMU19_04845 [Bryobacteraceae bacterium]|nr:hypothetical protein [Bryobacteraceae bacterium]
MNRLVLGLLLLGVAASGSATSLASLTSGGSIHNGAAYGQSVTTPNGGPWDNIDFNFMDDSNNYAIGGLYVLTEAYTGAPGDLSPSTAGYLGFTSTITDGVWNFSGVTLSSDTQYFFYMDSIVPLGQGVDLVSPSAYAGGNTYAAGGGTFVSFSGYDMEFVLAGDQVSNTPEPGTLALVACGLGLAAMPRRRKLHRA